MLCRRRGRRQQVIAFAAGFRLGAIWYNLVCRHICPTCFDIHDIHPPNASAVASDKASPHLNPNAFLADLNMTHIVLVNLMVLKQGRRIDIILSEESRQRSTI